MSSRIEADYVIVGAGSAGCVLANRLSENPAVRVVLIEAGGKDSSPLIQMPVGMAKLISDPKYDWRYMSEPDPSINGRRFMWSAGKVIGGSSAINGQVYMRGIKSDYDNWAAAGCSGWSFDEVLPYFKRAERFEGQKDIASHGRQGLLSVSPMRTLHPLSKAFIEASRQSGLALLDDYCGGEQHGAFLTLGTQRDGLRCSSAKAYLDVTKKRSNLHILTDCTAQRILLDGSRAVGVLVKRGGEILEIRAQTEVLLSCGTVSSPALLMRSGIGPAETLGAAGITVAIDSPNVGRNLQEHPVVGINKLVNVPTYNSAGALHLFGQLLKFVFMRQGMLTTPAVQAMACIKTLPEMAHPDVQLHFLPLTYDIEADTVCTASADMPKEPAMLINFNVCRPYSRGEIRVRSADAEVPPVIDHRLLGDERDVATLVRACRIVEDVFQAPALRQYIVGNRVPASLPVTDEGWSDYIRDKAVINYHPVGSCRMGNAADGVVDSNLKLYGTAGLRVVDASVIPASPSANTNAATIMIAEKAADMIKAAA